MTATATPLWKILFPAELMKKSNQDFLFLLSSVIPTTFLGELEDMRFKCKV